MEKMRPGVNFTNILQAAFAPIYFSFPQNITNPNCRMKIKAMQNTLEQKNCELNIGEKRKCASIGSLVLSVLPTRLSPTSSNFFT